MVLLTASLLAIYFLALAFSFLGLYVGAVLAFISPEELKGGFNYFQALQAACIILVTIFMLRAFDAPLPLLIISGIVTATALYFLQKTPISQISYYLFGFAFFFSSFDHELFTIIVSLIFLFGIPAGTLFAFRHFNKGLRAVLGDILLNYGVFLVVALIANLTAIFVAVTA
ncbi:hypothetical protein HY772_05115 [Candidatus Woesearchaeota archaeon]|nr:hypothetical protein [Candidatus Woesearchaeota archaeon]